MDWIKSRIESMENAGMTEAEIESEVRSLLDMLNTVTYMGDPAYAA